MNVKTLVTSMAQSIAQDSAILAWANTHYGQDHYVFVNFDTQNPPGEGYCPCVYIKPHRKRVGQRVDTKVHEVIIICCIYDDASREYPGISNIVEFMGVSRLDDFYELVRTCIAGIEIGDATFSVVEPEYETIDQFPFMYCGTMVTLLEPVTMGPDYLA